VCSSHTGRTMRRLTQKALTLNQVIDLGEYNPKFLSRFSEFKRLSRYSQFQLIRKALKNREKQLRIHYAEIVNSLNFSKKPHLKKGLENIQKQIKDLAKEEDRLLLEYSG
jgi:hypothetical protein